MDRRRIVTPRPGSVCSTISHARSVPQSHLSRNVQDSGDDLRISFANDALDENPGQTSDGSGLSSLGHSSLSNPPRDPRDPRGHPLPQNRKRELNIPVSPDNVQQLPKRRRVDASTEHTGSYQKECNARETTGSGIKPIEYKALESVCENTDVETAVLELVNKRQRFEALLESEEPIRPDMMKLIIRTLYRLCSSEAFKANVSPILQSVARTHFFNSHLSRFINQMASWDTEPGEVICTLITQMTEIFLRFLQQVGQSIADDLPLPQIEIATRGLAERNALQDVVEIEKKIKQVKSLKEEVVRKAKTMARGESVGEPLQNFRDVSIVPIEEDFRQGARPFLRANVVEGSYADVEHYLDVQFRLLREDLLIPLRDGVKQLRSERSTKRRPLESSHDKSKNIRIYSDVHVLNPVCSTKQMVYRIQFDWRHKNVRRVAWRKSARLKFGSLVCLSQDDFHTMFFATVENRDPRDLCHGELDVRFENVEAETVNRFISERESFEMVESEAYFEAYRHNLEVLQSVTEENLPFKEHIVHCNREIHPPNYLEETSILDLSVIMTKATSSDLEDGELEDEMEDEEDPSTKVPVLNIDSWPTAERLGLNDSQLRACQLALTKRFAVIQGPPGTGKTYVGLKIARALLHNTEVWQGDGDGWRPPILMISFTNHALDQFLLGLVDAMPKGEIGIVRVGGRSKAEALNRFTLKEHRNLQRQLKQLPTNLFRRKATLERRMRNIRENDGIDRASAILKVSRRCIFSFIEFASFMKAAHCEWFKKQKGDPHESLLKWLNVRRTVEKKDEAGTKETHYCTDDFRKVFSTYENADDDDEFFFLSKPPKPVVLCGLDEVVNRASLRKNLESRDVMSETEERRLERRLHNVASAERWQLYRLWLQRLEEDNLHRIQFAQPEYEEALREHQEVLREEEYTILRNARIVGMTTTCAARYRSSLERLRPKIILVEEAAEVLEAHVITSLTSSCEQLILIGDHQQLRPNPNVFKLAKDFKLDVSLFERMVQNGIPCERLSIQHRMRPEIATLIKHVYEDLHDHESVSRFEHIKGLKRNMFFIKHSESEEQGDDSHSHSNQHEAGFLVALCRYLLQQGYEPSQITMLTSYTGQMFALRDVAKDCNEERLLEVRVSTVDNFQGEENDIILLSFVRSNDTGKVGFINVTNRMCVALSRARKGLYCIGNFDFFAKYSEIWRKIMQDLTRTNSIGEVLSLVCQNHSQNEIRVKSAEDFDSKAPDGGCLLPCASRLACGHACRMRCHPFDHAQYRCIEPCVKPIRGCKHEHLCDNLCWEQCEIYCNVIVKKELPLCKHEQEIHCGKDPRSVKCKERCEKRLSCGHQCQDKCGEQCTTFCKERVKKTDWSCEHTGNLACSATQKNCQVPCGATLKCDHSCPGKCGECRQGRVHVPCKKRCERLLICSHVCGQKCMTPCSLCTKPCENRCTHSECDKRCGELCIPCNQPCSWKCPHFSCSKLCNEMCDRPRCDEPCGKVPPCGQPGSPHVCRALCGEECICATCETANGKPITEVFLGGEDEEDALFIQLPDCKHIFAVSDLDRYMDMQDEETQAGENVSIQMKICPRCRTAIRKSLRYGNTVKQRLRDIENVKSQLFDDQGDLERKKRELKSKMENMKEGDTFEKTDWAALDRLVENEAADPIAMSNAINKVNLLGRCIALNHKLNEAILRDPLHFRSKRRFISSELNELKRRITRGGVTEQVFCEVHVELTRLSLCIEVSKLRNEVKQLDLSLSQEHQERLDEVEKELSSGCCIPEEKLDQHLADLAETRKSYPSLKVLTEEERQEIVKAVGVKKGSWFKCPKGHYYAIGECGGAMERGKCAECGAVIGGSSHQVDPTNSLAPEMDNAQHPAWSEQANMENYILIDD